jgi:hypothetical protein
MPWARDRKLRNFGSTVWGEIIFSSPSVQTGSVSHLSSYLNSKMVKAAEAYSWPSHLFNARLNTFVLYIYLAVRCHGAVRIATIYPTYLPLNVVRIILFFFAFTKVLVTSVFQQ